MSMRSFLVKRIVVSIFILWVLASLNFVLFQVASPVDPTRLIIDPKMTQEAKELLRVMYGLREPLTTRYIKYLRNMFTFGLVPPYFGVSFFSMDYVAKDMGWRLALTILLLGSALIGNIIVGIPLGITAAARRGGKADVLTIGVGLFTWGVPTFFIQLLFLLFFYYVMITTGVTVLPLQGTTRVPPPTNPLAVMGDLLWHVTLPVITLVVSGFGSWALYTRNMLIETLTQDYIVTARAKGLSERTILYKHAFKGILPMIATMITLSIPGIVTGAVITEGLFNWKGIGSWYITALQNGDFPVTQAVLWVYGVLVILFNFIADIIYGALDPRIRVGTRR